MFLTFISWKTSACPSAALKKGRSTREPSVVRVSNTERGVRPTAAAAWQTERDTPCCIRFMEG